MSRQASYVADNVVSHNGGSYIALGATTGDQPESSPANRCLMAQKATRRDRHTGAHQQQLTWKGAWDVATAYVADDVVSRNGHACAVSDDGRGA